MGDTSIIEDYLANIDRELNNIRHVLSQLVTLKELEIKISQGKLKPGEVEIVLRLDQ